MLSSNVQRPASSETPPESWPPGPLFTIGPAHQREELPRLRPSRGLQTASVPRQGLPWAGGWVWAAQGTGHHGGDAKAAVPGHQDTGRAAHLPAARGGQRSRSSTGCLRICMKQTLEPPPSGTPAARSLGTGPRCISARSRLPAFASGTHAGGTGPHHASPGLGRSLSRAGPLGLGMRIASFPSPLSDPEALKRVPRSDTVTSMARSVASARSCPTAASTDRQCRAGLGPSTDVPPRVTGTRLKTGLRPSKISDTATVWLRHSLCDRL